jgi:short-subunit dehydrogenase
MTARQPEHIVITGAGGAIGGALARSLAARYPDAKFTLVDRTLANLEAITSRLGHQAVAAAWDLAHPAGLDELWDTAIASRGPVDLLINCAGIMDIRSFGATSWAMGETSLNVNFLSPLKLMHLAVRGMLPRGNGAVVNVSSMAGRVPIRGCTFYGAAKTGIAQASEIAFLELRPKGIHILTVYPGPVESALEARARGQVKQGFVSRNIPTGTPDELARQVLSALERRKIRVVYPAPYRLAYLFLGISGWVTTKFSPSPLDETEQTPEKETTHGAS